LPSYRKKKNKGKRAREKAKLHENAENARSEDIRSAIIRSEDVRSANIQVDRILCDRKELYVRFVYECV
jgi:hypothetical protein